MKLTELFAQADPAFGEAMNTLLESFHHSDDSQAPYQRDLFTHQLDQSRMPAVGQPIEEYLARLATLVPGASHLTSPRYMGHMTAPLPAYTAELSRLLVMLNQNPMKMESS
ncbi:MAG: decarboxylase, partial [Aeromonas veronii]